MVMEAFVEKYYDINSYRKYKTMMQKQIRYKRNAKILLPSHFIHHCIDLPQLRGIPSSRFAGVFVTALFSRSIYGSSRRQVEI